MSPKGQLQLEAMICLVVLLSIIGVAIFALNGFGDSLEKGNKLLVAEAKAQKCSVAANILFANGGGKIETEENCYSKGEHSIGSLFEGEEKTAFSIAKKVSSNSLLGKTILE